jgi:hypothetical protein
VSPDGEAILLARDGVEVLVDPAGTVLSALEGATAFVECEECRS